MYSYAENTGYINNNSGFYISVENGVRRLGLIEVDNIDNKECFEKFFNMAKIIMSILGVCISNIRQFEESKISRKEMDIFSYTASHDLKTPLANVKMGIDLARDIIKEGIDKENISEIIDMIEKSIKSGMEMLEKNLLIIRS